MSATTSNVAMSETATASEARRETVTANEVWRKIARAANHQRNRGIYQQEVDVRCSQRLVVACKWAAECNFGFPQGFFLCMVNHI